MKRLAVAAMLAILCAPRLAAQAPVRDPAQAGQTCAAADAGSPPADLVIRASVQASELRFDAPPGAHLTVAGCAPEQGIRVVDRRNLPSRVEPGVTYRDVYIAVEIVGRLNAACIAALAGDTTALRGITPGACAPASAPSRAPPR